MATNPSFNPNAPTSQNFYPITKKQSLKKKKNKRAVIARQSDLNLDIFDKISTRRAERFERRIC